MNFINADGTKIVIEKTLSFLILNAVFLGLLFSRPSLLLTENGAVLKNDIRQKTAKCNARMMPL